MIMIELNQLCVYVFFFNDLIFDRQDQSDIVLKFRCKMNNMRSKIYEGFQSYG